MNPVKLFFILKSICITGFSTFFTDVAMGILTMLFNRQILKYLGTDALAVYSIIINISTFVQCCTYSIGHASQPMLSANFGAGKGKRIVQIFRHTSVPQSNYTEEKPSILLQALCSVITNFSCYLRDASIRITGFK